MFIQVIVFILRVFITIGDVVRFIFRTIIYLPLTVIQLTISTIKNGFNKITSLGKNIHFPQKAPRAPGRPRKQLSYPQKILRYVRLIVSLTHVMFREKITPIRDFFITIHNRLKLFKQSRLEMNRLRRELAQKKIRKEQELAKLRKSESTQSPAWISQIIPSSRYSIKNIFRRQPKRPLSIRTKMEMAKSFVAGTAATIFFIMIPFISYQWLKMLPNPQLLSQRDIEVTTKIFDRHGTLLYEIYSDQNRTPLPLDQIPKIIQEATLSIEDKDFYSHPGFSVSGILRATRETLLKKQVQGGSTITQQLIKNALLTPEVTVTRKIKEILLAFWAERLYTKNQILEMYLNQVPYGGTAWGIEAASQTYFGKSAKDVNLAEAALLAGLPAAPTEYSPFGSHPEKALERQKEVLRRMYEDRYITKQQEDEAIQTAIQFTKPRVAIHAPHFVMYVKDLLEQRFGPRLVEQGGLRIMTSLDLPTQEKVEEIVRTQVNGLASLRVGNGAALVTNPKTGEILAMVGSKDYFDTAAQGNVNVTTSLRQPGSSIKVVNYAAALESGLTAASLIDDSPISFQIPGSPSYAPANYDGKFHGMVPFRYALANSYNIPAVKILNQIGVHTMVTKGRLMGIESWDDESRFGLSLTLGAGEVTMFDMSRVYGTLANMGKVVDLVPILKVTDYTGHEIQLDQPKSPIQAVKPEVAWILSNILSDNTARIPAFGPNSSLVVAGKTVSVKTGTTDSKRDNWTIGYTPSFLTTVWVGKQ